MRRSVLGFLIAFALLWAVPAQAAITLITWGQKASVTSNPTTLSLDHNAAAIDTTGATLLVMGLSYYQTVGPGTCSDSFSNTWVQGPAAAVTAGASTTLFYVKNPTVGENHTFSCGATAGFPNMFLLVFAGTDTTANLDQSNSHVNGSTGATVQAGSVTPSTNGQVVIALATANAGQAAGYSIGSSFTITGQDVTVGGQAYGGAAAYLIQTTAAAVDPIWTDSNGTYTLAAAIATFTAAGGGAAPVRHRAITQ